MARFIAESIEGKVSDFSKNDNGGFKDDCLNIVGKIIAEKEISFKTCKNALMGIWENLEGVSISKAGRNKDEPIHNVRHDFMEFWVQIHGVPLEHMNRETARMIGEKMGTVVEVENSIKNNILLQTFLRVRVALEIAKPLHTGFWMKRDKLPNTRIEFKYERLQDAYCLNCGSVGLRKKECKNEMAMTNWDVSEPDTRLEWG
ncbi:hypothetical protein AHAS_Ahas04G0177000 [Arachis hypogaea]